ncbi:MAG TPA: TIGR03667 family PPOX class F420-dependent oxidoreductase [Candidatus Dormibacteraeota bacterium]|jgi:PPOX class probable F420-dependent enzyme
MSPDRKVQSRLKKDLVIWLGTAGADGRPHAVLVWFHWDGESFLVYSVPGQKVNDIKANPNVVLHLNSDPEGGNVVRITGTAKIVRNQPPASKVPAYIRKYRELIRSYEWTPLSFSKQYSVAIRIRPTKFH